MIRTLDGELIGNTTPLHSHGNPRVGGKFTPFTTAPKDIRDKTISRLLQMIKTKSPKLSELSRKLNQTGFTSNQKLRTSPTMSDVSNSSDEVPEEEEKEEDEEISFNKEQDHPRSVNKRPIKTIKWSPWKS